MSRSLKCTMLFLVVLTAGLATKVEAGKGWVDSPWKWVGIGAAAYGVLDSAVRLYRLKGTQTPKWSRFTLGNLGYARQNGIRTAVRTEWKESISDGRCLVGGIPILKRLVATAKPGGPKGPPNSLLPQKPEADTPRAHVGTPGADIPEAHESKP